MPKQNETAPESAVDVSPEKSDARRQRIDQNRDRENDRINSVVRTSAPEKTEVEKKTDDEPKIKKTIETTTSSSVTREAANVRHLESSGSESKTDSKHEPFRHARSAVIGAAAGMTALGSLGTGYLSQIPLLGKIPYFPQAGAAMFSGLNSLVTPLGLGTGTSATNWLMAMAPNFVGPTAAVALGIPTALYGIGMAKGFIKGERYGSFGNHVSEGTRLISELPFWPYKILMKAREETGQIAKSTWNTATAPIKGTWNLGKTIAKGTWKGAKEATTAALKPTWSGGIGAGIGSVFGVMGAPLTGGASLVASPLLGYAAGNIFKNSGASAGKGQASLAHA
ncbi:MAG: hypothetical protein KBC47_03755 [Candidatus Peribacteraceae bacterium]|nr:hypothetical protein [Candidatus Peribacteraceae bacterium]